MRLTPGMKQYMDIKNANPDCIVLFRMGDFYETFFEDAKTVSRELEITLTSRGKGDGKAPLAGIPYHSIDPYIAKLVKKGFKVAIVEQMEDPKKAKGLVKRDVVRIITPGTVVESLILDEKNNNYLICIFKDEKYGLSVVDISTGEFMTTEIGKDELYNEIRRLGPSEIIYPMSLACGEEIEKLKAMNLNLNSFDDRFFYEKKAENTLKEKFDVMNLNGFGNLSETMICASGALLDYLNQTQMQALTHIKRLKIYSLDNFMHLDGSTIRNLELKNNILNNSEESSLISVLDRTMTPMGKRLLRNWICAPLKDKREIERRTDGVEELKGDVLKRNDMKFHLDKMYDVERLVARISFGNASPKDLVSLKISLKEIPHIKHLLEDMKSDILKHIGEIKELKKASSLIDDAIKDEPNTTIREGNIIKKGYDDELDKLRSVSVNGKKFLSEMERKEKEKTGIKSLKIKFNRVFGYFIEVTKTNIHLVPEHYIRKQTQANSERYITEELKEMEMRITGAEERIADLEFNLFNKVIEELKEYIDDAQNAAGRLGLLDCLISFAEIAEKNNYVRPQFNEENILEIKKGRHPVIEEFSNVDFISNNCLMDNDSQMMIITGPNMAGKSTYMRQVALIVLMAQIGSFVPADSANLAVFDRIFTRVGAYDDLVSGQSTFMVEMNEAANILNYATSSSLIILDEIGRGTSTYDGLSLAWAISEYIYTKIKAKTLFATHYHHLNELANIHEGIKNYHVLVEENEDGITFLRRIEEGGTDKSYGIEVAKLAGIPDDVIRISRRVMKDIEGEVELSNQIKKNKKRVEININEGGESTQSLNKYF